MENTIAHQVAEAAGNDGLDFEGLRRVVEISRFGLVRRENHENGTDYRVIFSDDSAICTSNGCAAWDIEYPGHPWRWESEGPNPDTCKGA